MMPLKCFKILKNEPCPCGSELKYIECCYNKEDEFIDVKYINKILLETAKAFDSNKIKTCLHPNKSECKPPIKPAHAIQNNGILSQISYKNHVVAFATNKTKKFDAKRIDDNILELSNSLGLVGVNEATTHTCFCDYHDSSVFAPIENNPKGFVKNDKEQLFLYAYKAFAFEYYKSMVALNALRDLFKRIPQKLKKYPFLVVPHYRREQLKQIEMDYYKSFFDKGLIKKEYSGLETEIIEIPYKILFATTECISPAFDIIGNKVKTKTGKMMRRMFITIFPDNDKSYILLSYLSSDKKNFERYVQLLKSADERLLFNYLSVFLPLYSENLVISPVLWNHWGKEKQSAFNGLVNIINEDIIIFERRLAKNLKKIHKHKCPMPECSCNLFERL